MRTKVEKRRVRHDPPSVLLSPTPAQPAPPPPSEGGGSVNPSAPVVLSSTSLHGCAGDRHDLPPDLERRPVSMSEAERLAVSNHVVVALGPPVIVGPSRVMFEGKGEAGGGVAGARILHAHTGGVSKPLDSLPVNTAVMPQEKAIKKPPKKRRNNEKKMDVALDLSTTSTLHVTPATELHPSPQVEAVMVPAQVSAQLQQPPITPPTPSPQQLTPPSPQHTTLHNSALLCRSPPNPAPLLQQTPPSSSEPVMMDTGGDHLEMMDSKSVSEVQPSVDEEGSSVAQFVLSNSEVAPVPEPDLVLPSSQDMPSHLPSLVQPEAIQSLDAAEGDASSATSTSLLQPPTWLLTPQGNPPPGEGSAYQPMAASDQRTGETAPATVPSLDSHAPSSLSPPSKPSKKGAKSGAAKSKSAKSKIKGEGERKDAFGDSEMPSKNQGAVISDSPNKHVAAPLSEERESVSLQTEGAGAPKNEEAKSKAKAKKPPKKRPLADDENSEERIAKIEETINCVIARYVYDCDDVLKLDKLRETAREAEAKATEDDTSASSSCVALTSTSAAESINSSQGVNASESQPNASISPATRPLSKAKKKVAAKKKSSEGASTENSGQGTGVAQEGSAESDAVPPKKKQKKSKKKKTDGSGEVTDGGKGQDGGVNPEVAATEAQSHLTTKEGEDSTPVPPKKKKKAKKKKETSSVMPEHESQPVSVSVPNGHIEATPTSETLKPAKKKKSKAKVKDSSGDGTGTDKLASETGSGDHKAMETNSAALTQTSEADEGAAPKPAANSKPKKAKKHKSCNANENTSAESKATEGETKTEANAETKVDGECTKPPPKKKKKKEVKEGESTEPKRKTAVAKNKKAKQPKQGSEATKQDPAASEQNGLPNSHDGNEVSDMKLLESGETKPGEEAGTASEEGPEDRCAVTVEKKVKKTLDEVICPDCGHKTRGQAALSRHMKKMHEKSVVLPYPCPKKPDCEYSASKVSLLARHMLTHSLYMCSRCQFTVDTKDKYEEHLQSEHNVKLDCKLCKKCNRYVKCDTVPMEKHLEVCQGPVPFACDVCGKQFKYESSLKVHHHTHFPDQPKLFHCTQCDYSSNYRANLHKHVQNMHVQRPKDIKCLLCDKMFSTEDNMRRHMKIHTQVRPFKCDKCAKAFKSQCALRGHLVSHEEARPYKCNIDNCRREFRTPKFLKSHQEEFHRLIPKKYHCSVESCTFSFFKLSHLKRHEISHTGERNFHCDHPGCGKSFRHSDNLKVHLRQHTNERPISCPQCKFTCRQKSSLQWHLKKEHNQSLPSSGSENNSSDEVAATLEARLPEGFKLPEGMQLPEGVKLLPVTDGVEVVEIESANVIIPVSEGEELPVTITELRPMDLYDFHSDNDSSDEATPGVFKRDKTKMASAAPLPPPPKELLMKNSVMDVLGEEETKGEPADRLAKPKKKKSPSKKATKSKEAAASSASKENEETEKKGEEAEKADGDGKKKKKKTSLPRKASGTKSKKKTVDKQETAEGKEDDGNTQEDLKKDGTKLEVEEAEKSAEAKSLGKAKKAPAKKKTAAKPPTAQEAGTVEEKDKHTKSKAPAKGKKSPKTRASPKKPSSPKGKLAKPATRKTPPRKAATAKKGGKTVAKKASAKKLGTKKKTVIKKKSPSKKKAAKKSKEKVEEAAEAQGEEKEENEEQSSAPRPKPKEKTVRQKRSQTTRRSRETRNSAAAAEEASSPLRPSSPMDSEEENMPQGAGSPYREFDSQDMDDSSEPRDSPSPPALPTPVEEQPVPLPIAEAVNLVKEGEEDALPQAAQIHGEVEHHDEPLSSDAEDLINDIPLTPPRAPAPPPQESSDEEMIPSPPTHMPMSADTSDTAAPSSVLTDQPGSQAPEFQQQHSREEFQQPHSREEFQQPHSHQDFQQPHSHQDFTQPHSREEFQQPLSQQPQSVEYPQHHSREEIMQPHSREEYPQHHSREEYPQVHSREEYPQHHSREEYPQVHSREEYPQHHSREEYPQVHSREEYPQHHSREEYPQHHSREEYSQPHSREELQAQGSVPEPVSEPVPSVHSEGLPEDVAMPHSVVQYDPVAAQAVPTSEAESAYQYLQGLAQSGETISEPLAGEPSRLQQLEALAEKPHEDSRSVADITKSPVGAAPTSVITSLSPSATDLAMGTSETSSHRRMEILTTDRQVEQTLLRDSPSALPRLPEGAYDAYSALNPLAASAARDTSNLFPAPPGTPSFMRLTESEAMLQRQRMTTPFLPPATQPPERSLSRLPESSLQTPNPSALLRRPASMADGMFPGAPGMPQTMPRNPFTNTWASQDVRPPHWGQAPTYLQRPSNAPTTPFPFATKDNYLAGRDFMFDPTVRPAMTDRNMFASLSGTQSQRDLSSEPNPFQLDRFDLSTYFGSHPYSGASGLDYSRTACGTTPKTFDERYRQTAVSMSEFRPLPPTTSTDMFSGIGVGVNTLNSAGFNLDKYAMYGRDPMYHAAAQQLSDNTNSAFLTHATPTQHSMFDRDYPHRSLYPHQNPAYPLFNERQYPTAAKLTAHPTPSAMSQERDFMARPTANENQMQDPYRCGMLYNVMNRYTFE